VERVLLEKKHGEEAKGDEKAQKALQYLMKLYDAGDSQQLIEKINNSFLYVNEVTTFVKMARGILNLENSVSIGSTLSAVRGVLLEYAKQ